MNKVLAVFLDRVAERMTALVAGLVSSRVSGMHAAAQAEQQSELENLARQYEADGKTEIAQTLRKRALRLTTTDLAGEGTEIVHLTMVPFTDPQADNEPTDLRSLPDFSGKSKRKPRLTGGRDESSNEGEEATT
ncbi:MAG: hypothetical protein KDB01_14345 [Planctomycetaceae bacterium]|jgi:hypothetical protein|nr:hypothetical protein [Planctomycetaceae bacterium]